MSLSAFLKYFRLPISEPRSGDTISPFDLLIVTGLMFGIFIWSSTTGYFNVEPAPEVANDAQQLIDLFQSQLPLLTAVIVYLYVLAGFSVRDLPWGISWQATLLGIGLFIVLALLADALGALLAGNTEPVALDESHQTVVQSSQVQLWLATILHSVFNGVYEELYFLGIVLAVQRRWLWVAIIFSCAVRFSFHTYQGLENATVIMVMGIQMLLFYSRIRCLWPFMVAHMLADIYGLGLLGNLI